MKYPFEQNKPLQVITIIITIVMLMLAGVSLMSLIVKDTLTPIYGISDPTGFMSSPSEQITNPSASLYMQALTSAIGLFLIPALLFHSLFKINIVTRLGLSTLPPLKYWVVGSITMVAAGIFIQVLVQIMQAIPLPSSMHSLRSTGEMIDKLLNSFFTNRSAYYFVILTIVMALLPALGEEFFFRGMVQNIFLDFRYRPISAIVVTGLVFGAIHMEFDNLLGIWLMGIVLGLLYYYTGSLWVSITAHFLNNFMVVAGKYAYMSGAVKSDALSADTLPLYYTLPAGAVMVTGLFILTKWSGKDVNALPSTNNDPQEELNPSL